MKSPARLTVLVLIVSLVASAPAPLGAATTNTFRDEFNNISYGGNDGTAAWAGDWWDSEDQDPSAGSIRVDSDTAVDFVLWFATDGSGEYAERTADLSVFDTATLSFDYRRRNTDPSFSFKVLASANGPAGPFTEIFAIVPGNDAAYVGSGDLPITAYKSATTTIRFWYEVSAGPGKDFYVDNVEISAFSANLSPIAADDSDSTGLNLPVTIDVLANDTDPDLDGLTIDSATQGSNGSVVNNGSDVTYSPNFFWSGVDTFTYTVTDGNGGFDTATVTVAVAVGGTCYLIGDGGGNDTLARVDLGTSVESTIGVTGTTGITAAAFDPISGTLYASLPGQLGTVDTATGLFTPTASLFGGGFDNIQAIAFDTDGSLYAFHHRAGPKDLLVRIDRLTGAFIPDAFGPGQDSVNFDSFWPTQKSVVGVDINDLGHMYGVSWDDGSDFQIQWIFKNSGSAYRIWGASPTVDASFDATARLWMLSPTGTLSEPFGVSIALSGLAGYQAVACEGGVANQPPSAVDDADSTVEDAAVTVDVLGNDTDPDLDAVSVDSVSQGTNGSVVNNGTDVSYTPNLDWNGVDTFTYTVADGNGGFASAQVTVTVTAQPDPPVAVVDADTTPEDVAVTVDVLANDTDPELDSLLVDSVTQGTSGSVVNNGTDVTYTPNPGWNGIDTFTYTVADGNGGFDTATVTVTVTPANDDPTAVDDTDSTAEDTAVTVDVLANDTDPELDSLTVDSITQGANGSVVNNGTDVTYDPNPDWNGIDTFTYTVADGNGGFDTATVTITVTAVNDDPIAVDDTKTMGEDSSQAIPVLGNDSDPDGDPLTIAGVVDGTHGTVTNNGSNVSYTPDSDWNGIDTFTYTVSDGNGGSAAAQVTVTVTPVNDDPQGVPDVTSTPEDTPATINVLANDTDVDSAPLTITSATNGSHGAVTTDGLTVTYAPDLDWNGTDTFTYTVSDGAGGLDSTTVTVTVTPVNDDPVAVDDVATTEQDKPVNVWVLANDEDPDPEVLSVSAVTNGAHGAVVNHGSKVTYAPGPGWNGVDTFTYTVTDGLGGFDTASVTLTVTAGPNQPPFAQDDFSVTDEDTPVTVLVLANDSDPDGDVISVSSANQGAHGSVTVNAGSLTYSPDRNWSGIDSFSYTVADGGGGTATAAVVITVQPVNDAPTARADLTDTSEDTPTTISVLANDTDVDGDSLSVSTVTQGSHGVTTTDGASITYSPSSGWSGTDSFSYSISDGHGGFGSAGVTVTVAAAIEDPAVVVPPGTQNHPPVITVTGDTAVVEGEPFRLEVTAEDPDGDEVSISASGLPGWARVIDFGNGRATITGNPGFGANSSYEITVTAVDETVTTNLMVTIEVIRGIGGNQPPLIGSITFGGVNADGSFSFTIAASDPDGDPLSIAAEGLPPWSALTDGGAGIATISSDGVPDDAVGPFSVVVSVTDGVTMVTSRLERPLADLRSVRPPELTHQAFEIEGANTLVVTELKPRVATPPPPNVHLTPREGLMVAFGSAVETLKSQVVPALILGIVMAWMLMIGVGRTKEEEG
jgi:hypothetical protein